MACNLPLRKTMCATCPFREGSKYAALTRTIDMGVSRICHSTGAGNAINDRTGKPPHLCRGARDVQLQVMARVGFLAEPTDEAWNEERVACGMKPTAVRDPRA